MSEQPPHDVQFESLVQANAGKILVRDEGGRWTWVESRPVPSRLKFGLMMLACFACGIVVGLSIVKLLAGGTR